MFEATGDVIQLSNWMPTWSLLIILLAPRYDQAPRGLRSIDKTPIIIIIDWENSLFRNK